MKRLLCFVVLLLTVASAFAGIEINSSSSGVVVPGTITGAVDGCIVREDPTATNSLICDALIMAAPGAGGGLYSTVTDDKVAFRIVGHSTQTNSLMEIRKSDATLLFAFSNAGVLSDLTAIAFGSDSADAGSGIRFSDDGGLFWEDTAEQSFIYDATDDQFEFSSGGSIKMGATTADISGSGTLRLNSTTGGAQSAFIIRAAGTIAGTTTDIIDSTQSRLSISAAPGSSPVARILFIGGSGSGTNIAGANGTISSGVGTGTGTGSSLILQTPDTTGSGSGTQTPVNRLVLNQPCADSAGDAACGASTTGFVVVDATDTTTVVSTTNVTANSKIFLQVDSSLGTALSVTCNTQDPGTFDARVTARTAGQDFTITLDAGPTTNPLCLSYFIVN